MVRFCNDSDIMRYEPGLFGELHPVNQVLATGNGGEISGTTFETNTGDFESAGVEPGDCVYLRSSDGIVDGVFEIVTVDSETQLCISVLRSDSNIDPIAPPVSGPVADVFYRISSVKPQIAEISIRLTEYLGIKPGAADSDYSADDILDTEAVRQICVFGVIADVYSTLGEEKYKDKITHYQRLFEKGKEGCRISLDTNGDGKADSTRFGGCGRLIRE